MRKFEVSKKGSIKPFPYSLIPSDHYLPMGVLVFDHLVAGLAPAFVSFTSAMNFSMMSFRVTSLTVRIRL